MLLIGTACKSMHFFNDSKIMALTDYDLLVKVR